MSTTLTTTGLGDASPDGLPKWDLSYLRSGPDPDPKVDETLPAARADERLLTNLLSLVTSHDCAAFAARILLDTHEDIASIARLSENKLLGFMSGDRNAVRLIRLCAEFSARSLLTAVQRKPLLESREDLFAYLRFVMMKERDEHVRVLYLDQAYHLVADDLIQIGHLEWRSPDLRRIGRLAIERGASALILVVSRPCESALPSEHDETLGRAVRAMAAAIQVCLVEHLILGRDGVYAVSCTEADAEPEDDGS